MKILYVITARGGSRGIPRKNIKSLGGKPLIAYSVELARSLSADEDICVSTDDEEIIRVVEGLGLHVPFRRPAELSGDHSGSYEVLLHALDYYESIGRHYDVMVLLQPTSPFRKESFVREALELYTPDIDMVVSVRAAASNPYYHCYKEGNDSFLQPVMGDVRFTRRQDAPPVWEHNGSIYVINTSSLRKMSLGEFTRCRKYVMDDMYSVDLDTLFDWKVAELLLREKLVSL
ncbi:MAG: acylneuraminate cytidylyltransferase family protein [Coprobacter sp.]|nr:acylneuraminate cytidylyltransferase family protein [Coprobacter sp.]